MVWFGYNLITTLYETTFEPLSKFYALSAFSAKILAESPNKLAETSFLLCEGMFGVLQYF